MSVAGRGRLKALPGVVGLPAANLVLLKKSFDPFPENAGAAPARAGSPGKKRPGMRAGPMRGREAPAAGRRRGAAQNFTRTLK